MTTTLKSLPIEIEPALIKDNSGGGYLHHQWIYWFPNGYGASVVCGDYTYGGPAGLYELAVLSDRGERADDFHLNYDTPITNDVLGHLTIEDIAATLLRIARL